MRRKKGLSSRLKTNIELQSPTNVADGLGGFSTGWVKVADIWAELIPSSGVRGKERLQFGNVAAVNGCRITVRYRDDVDPTMRLLVDGKYFNIRSVVDPDQSKQELRIYAESGVAT